MFTELSQLGKRKERRDLAGKDLAEAIETGNQENIDKFSRRLVRVTPQHNEDCKKLLRLMGIPYVDACIFFLLLPHAYSKKFLAFIFSPLLYDHMIMLSVFHVFHCLLVFLQALCVVCYYYCAVEDACVDIFYHFSV